MSFIWAIIAGLIVGLIAKLVVPGKQDIPLWLTLILGIAGNPPKQSLDILSTRIYSTFANSEFGYAAAQSIIFMAMIALVTWLQRRLLRLTPKGE